jgi:hypothetical protein
MGKLRLTKLTTFQTWGKPSPSPFIVYFVPLHEAHIQMAFFPKTTKWEFRNLQSWDSRNFGPHNFVSRPLIEMRSKAKL